LIGRNTNYVERWFALGEKVADRIMKRWLRIGGIVFAVLILVAIAIPFMINVNRFRPGVEAEASKALGRQVTVGNLSLSILSGSVGAENIVIADDPAFSKSPFVVAKSMKVGVELMPLIFSRRLVGSGTSPASAGLHQGRSPSQRNPGARRVRISR
jgi:AsmA family